MPTPSHFTPAFFRFLGALAKHNTREWFQDHKGEYERDVKGPFLAFLGDLRPWMAKVSPCIDVDPRPVGGSMQRLNRDTRFSKDKSPYRTSMGAMFMVEGAGELMLGYHLSLAPGAVKAYVGLWEPDTATIRALRERIVSSPADWKKATPAAWRASHAFEGESLARPPKIEGHEITEEHPLLEDLKRKSFAASCTMSEKAACSPDFLERYVETVRAGVPLMSYLCRALGVRFSRN